MKNVFNWSYEFPKITIALLLLVTVILGSGISKIQVRNSFDGELPTDDPINQGIEKLESHFGERSIVLLGLESNDIYSSSVLKKIQNISEDISNIPFANKDEVISLSTIQNISKREWGMETNKFLDEIPSSASEWNQFKSDITTNENVLNKIVSENGKLVVIAVALEDGFVGGEVFTAMNEIVKKYQGPEKIHITGAPILVEDVQQGISKDSRTFIPIAIVFIFLGFYFCFRTLSGVLLPVGMVIMSIIWTMGSMGYLGLPLTVVSNALPVIMVAVASSYGIHFMNKYYSLNGTTDTKKEQIKQTLEQIGTPILITGITSALGSASLLIFKITSLREFGIIGALGFLFATVICLSFLPALCALIRKPTTIQEKDNRIQTTLNKVVTWATQRKLWFLGAYAIIIPLCLFLATQIKIGDDYIKFFPKEHKGRIAAELFNENLGGVRVMDIMVDASAYGGITNSEFHQELTAFQEFIEDLDYVGGTHSYINIVSHIKEKMKTDIHAALTTEEIAQFLMLYEMNASPGEIFSLRDEDQERVKLQVKLTSSNPQDHKNLYNLIKEEEANYFSKISENIVFGGDVVSRISLSKYITIGKIQNILLALIIVLITCTLIFRSLKKGLITLIPIVSSLIMIYGAMGATGIRLGISTSLLTAMIVGIGIDFSIHYLTSFYKYKETNTADIAIRLTSKNTGLAITYDALSNILGFSLLSFSGFLPVQHFGWLLAFSMLLIFVNTIVLFPIMVELKPQKLPSLKPPNLFSMKYVNTLLFLFMSVLLFGQSDPAAMKVIQKYQDVNTIQNLTSAINYKNISKKGRVQKRELTQHIRRNQNGENQYDLLLQFTAPQDIAGTSTLTIQNGAQEEDDQWLYLPVLRSAKRISASRKSDRFMGTEMTYEDLSNYLSEPIHKYDYSLDVEMKIKEFNCYQIIARPQENTKTQYSKKVMFIDKESYQIVKLEFYDRKNLILKTYVASDIRPIEGTSQYRAHKILIENVQSQNSTEVSYEGFIIDGGIDRHLFSKTYLESL